MKVKVANKTYKKNNREYHELLKVASEQVPFGIYAIEEAGCAELLVIHCKSITQLKSLKRQFRAQGFKVYANGGG